MAVGGPPGAGEFIPSWLPSDSGNRSDLSATPIESAQPLRGGVLGMPPPVDPPEWRTGRGARADVEPSLRPGPGQGNGPPATPGYGALKPPPNQQVAGKPTPAVGHPTLAFRRGRGLGGHFGWRGLVA